MRKQSALQFLKKITDMRGQTIDKTKYFHFNIYFL